MTPPTMLERLAEHAKITPTKKALTYLGSGPDGGVVDKEYTYQDVVKETDQLALYFLQKGLKKGDLAVLVYPPSLDFIIAFIACLKAGIIAVPVFPPHPSRRDTLDMFSRIINSCDAKYALTSDNYFHMKKLSELKDGFLRFSNASSASWPEQLSWITTNNISLKKSKKHTLSNIAQPTDLAFLQFTSGSTSEPKGVMISHSNLNDNLSKIGNELQTSTSTVCVSWLPQYHDMGLIGSYLGLLYCGGSGFYLSPLTFLQRPMLWLEVVNKYRGTHLQAPNFAYKLTARKFEARAYSEKSLNLSCIQHMINAAEPVTEASIEAFQAAFGPFGLNPNVMFPTYGLAEHTVFVCSGGKQRLTVSKSKLEVDGVVQIASSLSSDTDSSRLIGCGYPAKQNVDVRIVDTSTMQEREEDQVGEIWVRSESKARGYYQKPLESKSEFCAQLGSTPESAINDDLNDLEIDYDSSEGYLRTGDLGFMHGGELFICGRMKDLIIVGGRNYYPQDIEATVEGTSTLIRPGCSAAFTVDPVSGKGEQVAVVLELREVPKAQRLESVCAELINSIRSAVNQEQSLGLSHIIILRPKTVPKTTSGKIARAWCRKAYLQKTLQSIDEKSFGNFSHQSSFEVTAPSTSGPASRIDPASIRSMSERQLTKRLRSDMSKMTSMPIDTIPTDADLITMIDSLSISQFKGLIETQYATKISDEYLFREGSCLDKIAKIVKLGYAPDDRSDAPPVDINNGKAKGVAGALGCPPGVVCCTLM